MGSAGIFHAHKPFSFLTEYEVNDNFAPMHGMMPGETAAELADIQQDAVFGITEHYGVQNMLESYETPSGEEIPSVPEQLEAAGFEIQIGDTAIHGSHRERDCEVAFFNGGEMGVEGMPGHYPVYGLPVEGVNGGDHLVLEDPEMPREDFYDLAGEAALVTNAHPGGPDHASGRDVLEEFLEDGSIDAEKGVGYSVGYGHPLLNDIANMETPLHDESLREFIDDEVPLVPEYDYHFSIRPGGAGVSELPEGTMQTARNGDFPVDELEEARVVGTPRSQYGTEIFRGLPMYHRENMVGVPLKMVLGDEKGEEMKRRANALTGALNSPLREHLGLNLFPSTNRDYREVSRDTAGRMELTVEKKERMEHLNP